MPKYEGIVIDLGVENSKLVSSLKEIDNHLYKTQRELTQVNSLLKFDPSNTDLLKQKQKLLADQLTTSRERFSKLHDVMKELEQQRFAGKDVEEQIRKIERETIKTEQSIRNLDEAFQDVNRSVYELDGKLESAEKQTKSFGDKAKDASQKVNGLDEQLNGKITKSIEAFGLAAVASAGIATKSFVEFSDQMVKVKTLVDESVMSYEESKKMVLDLSNATGLAAGGLATATYDALSSGVKTEELADFMATASKTAVAGFTDEANAVDILTTIMNSYHLKASDIVNVSNMLLETQDKGKVTVGDLSQGLGGLVGMASSAKVPLDQVLTAIATLTSNGLPASQSMTSLRQAISGIIKPTAEAEKMAQQLHLRFDAKALSAKGLAGVLADVQKKTKGNTEEMAQLFGSVEALNAVMILTTKDGSASFNETLGKMQNSAGKTDAVFKKVSEESGFKLKKSINELKNSLIEVGAALTPLINLISGVLTIIAGINPAVLMVIGSLVTIAAIILQIVKVIGTFSKIGGKFGKFFGGINTQAWKTTAIIIGVVAALIALATIIAVIIGKGGQLDGAFKGMGSAVGQVTTQVNTAGNSVPRNATGTNYHRGGGAIITEYGAEQLQLPNGSQYVVMPRGTKVTPNQKMRSFENNSSGDTFHITIDPKNVREFNDIVAIAQNSRQQRRAK